MSAAILAAPVAPALSFAAEYAPATMVAASDFLAWLLDMVGGNRAAARHHIEREIEWQQRLRRTYLACIETRERLCLPSPETRESRRREYRRIAACSGQLSRLFAMLEILDGAE